jgi:hypothetical protein
MAQRSRQVCQDHIRLKVMLCCLCYSRLDAKPLDCGGECGIEPDGFFEVSSSAVVFVLGKVCASTIVVGERVCGRELDSLAVLGDGVVIVALGHVCIATVMVKNCVLWLDPDGLGIIGYGALAVALVPVGDAAVVVERGVFGVELDRLGEVGDGAVEVAFLEICPTAIVGSDCILRIKSDRLTILGDRVALSPLALNAKPRANAYFGSSAIVCSGITQSSSPFRICSIFSPPAI